MTEQQQKEAAERRALVHTVRESRARTFGGTSIKVNVLQIESRIIPCCETCQHNIGGICEARPAQNSAPCSRFGRLIKDPEDLCIEWGASNAAFCRALFFSRQAQAGSVQTGHIPALEELQTARLNGKHPGVKKGQKLETAKSKAAKKEILKLSRSFDGANTDDEVRAILGLCKNTYYKYKAELKAAALAAEIEEILSEE